MVTYYSDPLKLSLLHSPRIAYQPPNPWTMGILGLLAEIYAMPNLKMNLKFEIKVLFKHLSVDLKDVTPTSLPKDRVREVEDHSGQARFASAEAPNEVLPYNCRPNFGAAWLTKDRFKLRILLQSRCLHDIPYHK